MELLEMVIIILQITAICARKRHKAAVERHMDSDESIENLLYYKDCKHKNKDPTPQPLSLRTPPEPPRQPACPCPRMCCSMCCDCNAPQSSVMERQMAPLQQTLQSAMMEQMQMPLQTPRQPQMAVQPQIVQRGIKKKKPKLPMKPNMMMQPPIGIGGRRNFGFTRENIKNLISQDQDIKKILKDLVRVTMSKVDLVEQVNARRNFRQSTTEPPVEADEEDYID